MNSVVLKISSAIKQKKDNIYLTFDEALQIINKIEQLQKDLIESQKKIIDLQNRNDVVEVKFNNNF